MAREKILIIEDEKLIRFSLAERLKKENFVPVEAGDGATGLKRLEEGDIDLVLLDIWLGDNMDGMTALEKFSAAEDKVSELQDALEVVGSVLETTEQIVIEGKKAGRCFRRLFKVLMVISIVAAIAMIVKKVLAGRSSQSDIVEPGFISPEGKK